MESKDLVEMIREKYPVMSDSYNVNVVLEQVPDGTGADQSRWVDVAVFKMWKMHGLTRSAFEIKVARSDFINELQHPEKHQWCRESFHEFWIVSPKDILKQDELPVGVGWMYPRGNKLCIGKHAAMNDAPVLNDSLLAAFMRAAFKETDMYKRRKFETQLQEDYRYKQAKLYQDGAETFLKQRGIHIHPQEPEEVEKALISATLDKQNLEDRDNFIGLLGKFQNDIVGLMSLFIVLAKKSLVLRAEYGRHVVDRYGGYDNEALEELRKIIKQSKNKKDHSLKNYLSLIEEVLNWKED